jgi:hypothetical protein
MTEKPKIILPAKVEKVIPSQSAEEPEKAEISVQGADPLYKEIRIKNELKDKDGNEVHLKRGDEVEVTVEAPNHAPVKADAQK